MKFAILLTLAIFAQGPPAQPAAPCVQGNAQFVCGQTAPEDLVLIPGSEWVVASSYGGAGQTQTTNIVKIDPENLKVSEVLTRVNTPEFGAGTVTLEIGKELWVGSFRGDRIAILPAP